ncbi:hypothetical protein LTR48_000197 [Friedmanniomyces endolithicus]|uniref:F-box domain-containing protein n=1 Tax=Rachicladosporium monterosium TaxID=1507873 RepID=A0ABR0LIZ5_9PEZI|nr:hypothetical protein LTS09_001027 [Friedmanniomyces endolithicus]KAK1094476.1 hypothetical protein LTR48_000197 [Friedmanniomyces endolithicus]KAK1811448.1 hypothetical protein LTR12_014200 [Friedmanniomyces endolithicus]KAK5148625.1 hypothetical protein LTR32_000128 [Rachicladosporium monterosium]
MPHTLLTLPPELRNQIYSYALPTETQEVRFSFSVFPRVPAITQVSKQIRAEASGIYYHCCAFDLVLHHRSLWQLRAWIATLPPRAARRLSRNRNLNLRLMFDEHHAHHAQFQHLLRFFIRGASPMGWFVSAESTKFLALAYMTPIHDYRREQGCRRAADEGLRRGRREGEYYVCRAQYLARATEGRDVLQAALIEVVRRVRAMLLKDAESRDPRNEASRGSLMAEG